MIFHVQIEVTLKPTVMDAQGTTIEKALQKLGHKQVSNVRIGKFISLDIAADSAAAAESSAQHMCQELLANPIIEQYAIRVSESGGAG